MNYNKYLNSQEFVDNNAKRIPVCIVVDCSGSMNNTDNTSRTRIDRVNNAIKTFYEQTKNTPKTRKSVDIMILEVGRNVINPDAIFQSTDGHVPVLKSYYEKCNFNEAIQMALNKLDERKEIYKNNSIGYWQPWLIIMSDGGVDFGYDYNTGIDYGSKENFNYLQNEIRNRESESKLSVFPIFIQPKSTLSDKTYNKRHRLMSSFSNNPDRLITIDVSDEMSFEHLFQFLHRSASSVANNKGIINDAKYGNFRQLASANNSKVDLYEYNETQTIETIEEIPDVDDSKVTEDLSKQQRLEKERIEQARRELAINSNQVDEETYVNKPVKNSIQMLVNGMKAFPIKKNEDGRIVLIIQLKFDDRVVLIKNNTSSIYDEVFHSDGRYEFVIDGSNVNVTKCEARSSTSDKKKRIQNINKEIEDVIYNISDWDKI